MSRRRSRSKSHSRQRSPRKRRNQHDEVSKYKIEQTKILCIEDVHRLTQQELESTLTDVSIAAGTSVPDEITLTEGKAYIKYPSIEVSSCVMGYLHHNAIDIANKRYKIQFHPFRKVDLTLSYDWYCSKCQYKNFARRIKCYRCETHKGPNCRLNYSSQGTSTAKYNKQSNIQNCSLMVRGPVIVQVEEEILLDIFQNITPVKDIRMIKNKMTGKNKDFVFIEFFSPQQTATALRIASATQFRINGQKVSVMYSRNKSDQDFKPLPYEYRQHRKQYPKKQTKQEHVDNYYRRQRLMEIEQEKQRPLITLEQLKEKRELEMKKNIPIAKEKTEEQNKRKQAELLAKQWEKQMKMENEILYICPLCRRRFKNQQDMKNHANKSQLHKWKLKQLQLQLSL